MYRTIAAIVLVALLALNAGVLAQDAQAQGLDELELAELLSVRGVTGARHDQRLVDSPRQIGIITADEIRRRNYRSVPAAVADVLGVYVQHTNDGGGSPIIRGLVGNQVLILIDGVRLNTGAYRLGPNQYLNTIDINQVERIEVLRGAGSVLYGSDALGGVINVITRSADENAVRPLTTRWFSRLSSANAGAVGRGEVAVTAGALGAIGGVSVKQFGQLRGGRDTGVQPFSGYDEWDGDLKVDYRLAPGRTLTFAGQHVMQSGVQRTDTLVAGTDLKMEWDAQRRTGGSVRFDARELGGAVEQITVSLAYQQQAERYARIAASAPAVELQHLDRTNSLLANVQLTTTPGPRHLLTYGIDVTSDRITSRRQDLSLTTGLRRTGKGILADGAAYDTWAVFLQDEFDVSPRLHLNLGARYNAYHPDAVVSDVNTGAIRIDSRQTALTGSVFGLFRLTPAFDVIGGVAQGFRAPNIDDLTVLGRTGSRFEVPNPALKPESSINLEAGVRGRTVGVAGSGTYFLTDIDGLIQREAGTFEGRGFRDLDGDGVRGAAEPLIFQRQNAGRARIQGVELETRLRLTTHWTASGMLVRMVGAEQITGNPLRRIPPTHGRALVGWSSGGRLWAEGYSVFASRQTRLAPGDLTDARIPAGGTPGFLTFNARGGLAVNEALEMTLGLENLTNQTYRTHGSGIDAAGTNLIFGIDWTF